MREERTAIVRCRMKLAGLRRWRWAALILLSVSVELPAAAQVDPCRGGSAYVLILTAVHQLWQCDGAPPHRVHTVRLGRGGAGKTAEGDQRTPLGRYRLGVPRVSSQFGVFIPIEYPTLEERKRGYTGFGIGIHGLHPTQRWLTDSTDLDTTNGCVVVSNDDELTELAAWISSHHVRRVELE
jgi:hypothetical protein